MYKMTIVLVNGVAMSGKDTFIKFCMHHINHYMRKCVEMSLIDYDKKILKEYYGWDGEKSPEVRQLLSTLQMFGMKHLIQMSNMVEGIIDLYDMCKPSVVFVQMRRDEHINMFNDMIKEAGAGRNIIVKTAYIERPGIDASLSDADMEASNSKYPYDTRITNNMSLESLDTKAQLYVNSILNN